MLTGNNIDAVCVAQQKAQPDPAARALQVPKNATVSRITGIDALKGGAIILVILGHAIQAHVDQFDNDIVFRLIYSFHMSFFIILSGWFAAPEKPRKLRRTFVRLVLPVFSWYLVGHFVHRQYRTVSLIEFFASWIKSPDVGLWFLWVLFLCHLWLAIVRMFEARLGPWAYMIGTLVLWLIPISQLGLPLTKYYFPFFVLGYAVSRHWTRLARYRHLAAGLGILLFCLAFPHWHRNHAGLPAVHFHIAGHLLEISKALYLATHVVCALSGSAVFAYLLTLAARGRLQAMLASLGTQTLELYAIHQLLMGFAVGQGAAAVASSVIIATTASLGAIWLLRQSRWSSLALFGRIPRVGSLRGLGLSA